MGVKQVSKRDFVFRMSWGQFEGTAKIVYTRGDIAMMENRINDETETGVIYIGTSKTSGKPYAYFLPPKQQDAEPGEDGNEVRRKESPTTGSKPAETPDIDDNLPF